MSFPWQALGSSTLAVPGISMSGEDVNPASPLIDEIHAELLLDMHPATGLDDLSILKGVAKEVASLKVLVPSFKLDLNVKVTITERWGGA